MYCCGVLCCVGCEVWLCANCCGSPTVGGTVPLEGVPWGSVEKAPYCSVSWWGYPTNGEPVEPWWFDCPPSATEEILIEAEMQFAVCCKDRCEVSRSLLLDSSPGLGNVYWVAPLNLWVYRILHLSLSKEDIQCGGNDIEDLLVWTDARGPEDARDWKAG